MQWSQRAVTCSFIGTQFVSVNYLHLCIWFVCLIWMLGVYTPNFRIPRLTLACIPILHLKSSWPKPFPGKEGSLISPRIFPAEVDSLVPRRWLEEPQRIRLEVSRVFPGCGLRAFVPLNTTAMETSEELATTPNSKLWSGVAGPFDACVPEPALGDN